MFETLIQSANDLIDEALELQNEGRWDEAETKLAAAELLTEQAEAV